MVSSEILMASEMGCPIEMHKIKVEQCDEMYDKDCKGGKYMPFYRAGYDSKTGQCPNMPREQVSRRATYRALASVRYDLIAEYLSPRISGGRKPITLDYR